MKFLKSQKGKTTNPVPSQFDDFELETPRDHDKHYHPPIIIKRQTNFILKSMLKHEGFHRQLRKYNQTKGAFTSEMVLKKISFCDILNEAQ